MTLLEFEGTLPRVVNRNDTPRSRACHDLIRRFLASGLDSACVTGQALKSWGCESLYRGLWSACNNAGYRGRVRVSRSCGSVYLVRCCDAPKYPG